MSGTVAANDKIYDGTTSATLNLAGATLAGLVPSDAAAIGLAATFAGKHVGTGIAVTNPRLSGPKAIDYLLAFNLSPLSANITPAPLTVTGITADNKTFDFTTIAHDPHERGHARGCREWR